MKSLSALNVALVLGAVAALDPCCAPGGNFDLSIWNLQLPTGKPGHPDAVKSADLEGCHGYQNDQFFYTDSQDGGGALVMKVPGSPASAGCVTTADSKHCRTELRESAPSSSSWDPNAAVNRLSATLAVARADDSRHGTVVGQIHMADDVSVRPVCELFCSQDGVLAVGVERTRSGGNEVVTTVGRVPLGARFSYKIAYERNVLSVQVNDGDPVVLDTFELDAPKSYFKAGNYNQGDSPSEVHFYAISVEH